MSISRGNSRLTSRFCRIVLCPTTILKMISKSLQDLLDHLLSSFRYRISFMEMLGRTTISKTFFETRMIINIV